MAEPNEMLAGLVMDWWERSQYHEAEGRNFYDGNPPMVQAAAVLLGQVIGDYGYFDYDQWRQDHAR